jgi:hypothetical protein
MIKLTHDYKHHKAGEIVDLGCVMNRRLIDVGWAQKLKIEDVKYTVK